MRRIRTGVVGYGLAGRVFHAPFVSAVPDLELIAVVQRTGDTAKEAYPAAAQMRSFEELLKSDAELVVVGTPTPTHFALSKQALLAGKHVVCDKPVTMTLAEAEELESLAKQQGLLLYPFYNRRWDGDFVTLRLLLAEGKVGRPVTLDSRFDRFRPLPKPHAWREEELGGGLLYDIGPHLIDQALVLFGVPDSLSATLRHDRDTGSVTDAFDLTLHFTRENGQSVTTRLGTTVLAADPAPRYRLHGTTGSFVKYGLDPQEPTIVAGRKPPSLTTSEAWLPEDPAMYGTLTTAPDPAQPAKLDRTAVPTTPGDYRHLYQNVADALLGKAEPAVTPRDAVRVARIIDLAQESQRTGTTIRIDRAGW